MRKFVFCIFVNLIFVSISCSILDHDPIGPEEFIDIHVSTDSIPVFSWNEGPINRLFIRYADTLKWGIITPGEDGIVSPVTYGIVPDGAELYRDSLFLYINDLTYGKQLESDSLFYVLAEKHSMNSNGVKEFTLHYNK